MALTKGWTNHLVATKAALDAAIEEIERIGRKGLPPAGGTGQPLTPLPHDEWSEVETHLSALKQEMDGLIKLLAPQAAARRQQRQPMSATRFYLSMALTMLQEQVIDDLVCRGSDRYGVLATSERKVLTDFADRMRELLTTLQADVKSMGNQLTVAEHNTSTLPAKTGINDS